LIAVGCRVIYEETASGKAAFVRVQAALVCKPKLDEARSTRYFCTLIGTCGLPCIGEPIIAVNSCFLPHH
jgi:hypothetical protein